jgi:hypothetical protein
LNTPPSGSSAPSGAPASGGNAPAQPTYQQESKPAADPLLSPIPSTDSRTNSFLGAPRLIDPENHTTMRDVRPATSFYRIASPSQPIVNRPEVLNDGGWEPARQ